MLILIIIDPHMLNSLDNFLIKLRLAGCPGMHHLYQMGVFVLFADEVVLDFQVAVVHSLVGDGLVFGDGFWFVDVAFQAWGQLVVVLGLLLLLGLILRLLTEAEILGCRLFRFHLCILNIFSRLLPIFNLSRLPLSLRIIHILILPFLEPSFLNLILLRILKLRYLRIDNPRSFTACFLRAVQMAKIQVLSVVLLKPDLGALQLFMSCSPMLYVGEVLVFYCLGGEQVLGLEVCVIVGFQEFWGGVHIGRLIQVLLSHLIPDTTLVNPLHKQFLLLNKPPIHLLNPLNLQIPSHPQPQIPQQQPQPFMDHLLIPIANLPFIDPLIILLHLMHQIMILFIVFQVRV